MRVHPSRHVRGFPLAPMWHAASSRRPRRFAPSLVRHARGPRVGRGAGRCASSHRGAAPAQGLHLGGHGRGDRRREQRTVRADRLRVPARPRVDDRRSAGRDPGGTRCRRHGNRRQRFARERAESPDRPVPRRRDTDSLVAASADDDGGDRFVVRGSRLHRLPCVDVERARRTRAHDVERHAHRRCDQRQAGAGRRDERGDRRLLRRPGRCRVGGRCRGGRGAALRHRDGRCGGQARHLIPLGGDHDAEGGTGAHTREGEGGRGSSVHASHRLSSARR